MLGTIPVEEGESLPVSKMSVRFTVWRIRIEALWVICLPFCSYHPVGI